ncbi:hypothetical protein [Francisella hispaniensis]|uniref:hypothetical protein n=1 Tax=Francisella hispaniensis TaxID=622488 RepID=UPI001903134B|nr:hypothetical protein [Francisella hispaniensis]MBK2356527.1 hypothetical protein [Francisella hispaniensis]
MKKISKVVGGLLLIAGISACSSDTNLSLVANPFGADSVAVRVNNISAIKGFIATPNPNATIFNYTITGDLAGCQVATLDSTGTLGNYSVNSSSGTTYGGVIAIDCDNLPLDVTYSGTVSMTTTSGGYNYSGSIPVTITNV